MASLLVLDVLSLTHHLILRSSTSSITLTSRMFLTRRRWCLYLLSSTKPTFITQVLSRLSLSLLLTTPLILVHILYRSCYSSHSLRIKRLILTSTILWLWRMTLGFWGNLGSRSLFLRSWRNRDLRIISAVSMSSTNLFISRDLSLRILSHLEWRI